MRFLNLFTKKSPCFDVDDGSNIAGSTVNNDSLFDLNDTNDTNTDDTPETNNTEKLDMSDSLFDLDDTGNSGTADTNTEDSNSNDSTDTNNTDTNINDDTANVDQQQQEEKFKVKYNGEEVELTRDEITANAQKGMNYDKVLEQKQALEEQFKILDYFAQVNGMNRQEYLKALEENKQQSILQAEIDAVKSENDGIQDNLAVEMAQFRIEKRQFELEKKKAEDEAKAIEQEKQAKQEEANKMFTNFMAQYPEVKAETIPQQVWDMVDTQCMDLTTAYVKHENQQLKAEMEKLKIQNQNIKNKSKSTGSIINDATNDEEDSFVKGLF